MQQTTTPKQTNSNDVMTQPATGPKKSTLDFIKQFARAYKYNARMPKGLEGIVLN